MLIKMHVIKDRRPVAQISDTAAPTVADTRASLQIIMADQGWVGGEEGGIGQKARTRDQQSGRLWSNRSAVWGMQFHLPTVASLDTGEWQSGLCLWGWTESEAER